MKRSTIISEYQRKRKLVLQHAERLGTMSDEDLERELDLPGRFVRTMRYRLGIPVYSPFQKMGRRKNRGPCQACGAVGELTRYRGKDICGACLNAGAEPPRLQVWTGGSNLSDAQSDGIDF